MGRKGNLNSKVHNSNITTPPPPPPKKKSLTNTVIYTYP